jgi:aminoglycoside phosphotransferase (APT) family kinase protein
MQAERVAAYLAHVMPDAHGIEVTTPARISGGASRETWSFDATWRDAESNVRRGFILRRDPEASLLETARDAEFRVYQAMQGTGVPVPEVYWLENDPQWLDRPFFVMGRLPGEASPQRLIGGGVFREHGDAIAQQKAEILARIHSLDWSASGGLGLDFLGVPSGPDTCASLEIDRWERIMREEALEPQPALELAIDWMRKHQPVAPKVTVVHADYRTGNFLVDGDRITGVLDWEMAHLGDPMEDVAWVCLRPWRWAGDARAGGLLMRDDFYRRNEAAGGPPVDPEAVRFWEVLGNVKLAAIFLTGARSYCEGRTHSAMMAFLGRNVSRLELEVMDLMGAGL